MGQQVLHGCATTTEAMRRAVKHYNPHDELKVHMQTFLMAYNFARRLKTLKELTPFEFACKISAEDPDRFIINPHHHTVGLNTVK
jgi:hypothetical protein